MVARVAVHANADLAFHDDILALEPIELVAVWLGRDTQLVENGERRSIGWNGLREAGQMTCTMGASPGLSAEGSRVKGAFISGSLSTSLS